MVMLVKKKYIKVRTAIGTFSRGFIRFGNFRTIFFKYFYWQLLYCNNINKNKKHTD